MSAPNVYGHRYRSVKMTVWTQSVHKTTSATKTLTELQWAPQMTTVRSCYSLSWSVHFHLLYNLRSPSSSSQTPTGQCPEPIESRVHLHTKDLFQLCWVFQSIYSIAASWSNTWTIPWVLRVPLISRIFELITFTAGPMKLLTIR
jgi:hypothetical protein